MKTFVGSVCFLTAMSLNALAAAPNAIDLVGKVASSTPECEGGKVELYVSEKTSKTLLYQVDVIPNGTFEFHLKEGAYLLKAESMKGCSAEAALEARVTEPQKKITLTLSKRKGDLKK